MMHRERKEDGDMSYPKDAALAAAVCLIGIGVADVVVRILWWLLGF